MSQKAIAKAFKKVFELLDKAAKAEEAVVIAIDDLYVLINDATEAEESK